MGGSSLVLLLFLTGSLLFHIDLGLRAVFGITKKQKIRISIFYKWFWDVFIALHISQGIMAQTQCEMAYIVLAFEIATFVISNATKPGAAFRHPCRSQHSVHPERPVF
jgi:hypothetical protein